MAENNDLPIFKDKIDEFLSNQELQWLRCPDCGHRLRKECVLIGKIERKCKNCKQTNTFIYNDLDTLFEIIFEKNEKKT